MTIAHGKWKRKRDGLFDHVRMLVRELNPRMRTFTTVTVARPRRSGR